MPQWRLRFERKKMDLPSGDQAGMSSRACDDVICVRFEPSASIIQMSVSSWDCGALMLAAKAMCFPSGDQAGCLKLAGLFLGES